MLQHGCKHSVFAHRTSEDTDLVGFAQFEAEIGSFFTLEYRIIGGWMGINEGFENL